MPSIDVPSRFNGPPTSGQGGYSSALLAARLDRPAAVSLRRPIPLDEAIEVSIDDLARDLAHGFVTDAGVVFTLWIGKPSFRESKG